MLSILMVAALAAQLDNSVGPSEYEAKLGGAPYPLPMEEIHTVEWRCFGTASVAQFKITGRSPTATKREYRQKVELVRLEVGGRPATQETVDKMKVGLEPFISLGTLLGRCYTPPEPTLVIQGHVLKGDRHERRVLTFKLY